MENEISLFIGKPCNRQWSAMQDVEGGKFCTHCNKTVFDFTGMTDADMWSIFKNNDKKLCGRMPQFLIDTNRILSHEFSRKNMVGEVYEEYSSFKKRKV